MNCWLKLRRHTPGRTWDGYAYRWAECSACARRYSISVLRHEIFMPFERQR